MLSVDLIREQLVAVAAGQLSLDDFEDWIVASSWNAIQHASPDVKHLVGAIELRLAEHSCGHLEGDELLEELRILASNGIPMQPVEVTFMSLLESSELATTLTTFSSAPDVDWNPWTFERATLPATVTASGRSVVKPVSLNAA